MHVIVACQLSPVVHQCEWQCSLRHQYEFPSCHKHDIHPRMNMSLVTFRKQEDQLLTWKAPCISAISFLYWCSTACVELSNSSHCSCTRVLSCFNSSRTFSKVRMKGFGSKAAVMNAWSINKLKNSLINTYLHHYTASFDLSNLWISFP